MYNTDVADFLPKAHRQRFLWRGKWQFAMDSTDVGITEKWFERSFADKIQLPGTTDEAGYGIRIRFPFSGEAADSSSDS